MWPLAIGILPHCDMSRWVRWSRKTVSALRSIVMDAMDHLRGWLLLEHGWNQARPCRGSFGRLDFDHRDSAGLRRTPPMPGASHQPGRARLHSKSGVAYGGPATAPDCGNEVSETGSTISVSGVGSAHRVGPRLRRRSCSAASRADQGLSNATFVDMVLGALGSRSDERTGRWQRHPGRCRTRGLATLAGPAATSTPTSSLRLPPAAFPSFKRTTCAIGCTLR
jgi:hypothetical protein